MGSVVHLEAEAGDRTYANFGKIGGGGGEGGGRARSRSRERGAAEAGAEGAAAPPVEGTGEAH
jgi:hypothetical protein